MSEPRHQLLSQGFDKPMQVPRPMKIFAFHIVTMALYHVQHKYANGSNVLQQKQNVILLFNEMCRPRSESDKSYLTVY